MSDFSYEGIGDGSGGGQTDTSGWSGSDYGYGGGNDNYTSPSETAGAGGGGDTGIEAYSPPEPGNSGYDGGGNEQPAAAPAPAPVAAEPPAPKEKTQQELDAEFFAQGLKDSTGANATEMMQKGYAAAEGTAAAAADTASTSAIRKAIQAARTAGVNKGQSALLGGQAAGDVYTNTFQGQLEAGQNRYQTATNTFAGTDAQKAAMIQQAKQLELDAQRLDQEGKTAEAEEKRQKSKDLWNIIGGIAGAAISIFSDINLKENVVEDNSIDKMSKPTLDSILGKIMPIKFNYKDGVADKKTHIGVSAQDLEKTPLAGAVIDTPAGKKIDTGQVELGNLALIIELASKVKELQSQLGGMK